MPNLNVSIDNVIFEKRNLNYTKNKDLKLLQIGDIGA